MDIAFEAIRLGILGSAGYVAYKIMSKSVVDALRLARETATEAEARRMADRAEYEVERDQLRKKLEENEIEMAAVTAQLAALSRAVRRLLTTVNGGIPEELRTELEQNVQE